MSFKTGTFINYYRGDGKIILCQIKSRTMASNAYTIEEVKTRNAHLVTSDSFKPFWLQIGDGVIGDVGGNFYITDIFYSDDALDYVLHCENGAISTFIPFSKLHKYNLIE